MVSLTIVFLFFSGVSYLVHGAFTFKDHGERDRHHVRGTRFLAINILGFASTRASSGFSSNISTGRPGGRRIPMVLFTPLLTFALHRRFVYA